MVNLHALQPVIHHEEVIDQVLEFFELLIRFPEVALEDDEGLNIEWNLRIGNDAVDGVVLDNAQLDHIENLVFIGPAEDDVIGSLFIMRTKEEQ
jgi:hypothetical protein